MSTINVVKSTTKYRIYGIDPLEMEMIRCALVNYVANTVPTFNNEKHLIFIDSLATVINNTLVDNGE